MTTISEACAAIQASLATVEGLESIPPDPPDRLANDTLPTAIVYPGGTEWDFASHSREGGGLHLMAAVTMIVQVFIARRELDKAIAEVRAYKQAIPLALFRAYDDHRFHGTVAELGQAQHLSTTPPIRDDFGEDDWAEDMIRLPFQVDVLVEVTDP